MRQEIDELEAENGRLRAALARSKDPCVYCQLPAEEIAKCKSGFPGCGRADDMSLCPEFGAAMNEHHLQQELAARDRELAEAVKYVKQLHAISSPVITPEFDDHITEWLARRESGSAKGEGT